MALEILTGVCATLPDPEFTTVAVKESEDDMADDGKFLSFSIQQLTILDQMMVWMRLRSMLTWTKISKLRMHR